MSNLLFRVGISLGLIGVTGGIIMGIMQDFRLAPAHAHLNLVGFVILFLAGLYYRVVPQAAASQLARYQVAVSILGAVVFPVGIAAVTLGKHETWAPLVIFGSLIVLAGLLMFATVVFQSTKA
ncbi:MAG TPA: hypothetical protein VJR30_16315 [Bradyrhizobium sp.]|nr:hypothetical protein [Bradyrhizobium sp.]